MSIQELERLYDAHASSLYAFLLNLTRDEAETRDLLQDLFARLASRPGLLKAVRDERGFLIRMANNLALDSFRRRETRSMAQSRLAVECIDPFCSSSDPDETAFRRELAAALGELPSEQRAVVHLKLWEGLTFEAIASALDIPLNTAASRYRYGLDKLRGQLRPLYDEIRTR